MIRVRGIRKAFGKQQVLRGVDFTLPAGQVLVIIGPSGSGKTTLLRCLNLLEVPDHGTLELGNVSFAFTPGAKLRPQDVLSLRKRTGMVFQSFNLFPHMTALGNVIEAQVTVQKKRKSEAEETARLLLGKVGLADRADYYPHKLSGGQQQRVAIARAMALEPEVLLFDEPTSALDPELAGEVLKVMKQLAAEGLTMVIVTHLMKFAEEVADHVLLMDEGLIVEEGPPHEVFRNPKSSRAAQFLSVLTD
ncbi:amino acid ABC transporter ATP-binding protein [Cohnella panacarvi]|uniref:amino acid ABC transporter ATP-binding protein n=1 Tax=Cohnella panacarvi TaxID=400776 RepID=UPI000478F8F2|nr:amino acid ABC transporter ATP-binding protein [Cohnella panacarvi]